MPASQQKKKKLMKKKNKSCICSHGCHDEHAHLPGYLLIGFGLLLLPLNFGVYPIEWEALEILKAWPVLLVLLGIVFIVKNAVCKMHPQLPGK